LRQDKGLEFKVQGFMGMVYGPEFRAQISGLNVYDSGFRVQGLWFRV